MVAEITDKGEALKEQAVDVPSKLVSCIRLDSDDAVQLYDLLHKILAAFKAQDE